ncbi:hypothetical protein EDB19DRAFT_1688228 [Suillus lakei]|nr:hypothetical protein EDB19DRAFT_1688228 [Suillus lakei]
MSLQQNPSLWSFTPSHLNPEYLNSHQSTLSPLHTPSGSFQSLRNISPGPTTPAPSTNGEQGSHYYPVPSERIFSSSKETCTLRRSNLSPTTLEALQVLKFTYKQDRLNFTEDLVQDTQYLDL